MGSCLEKLKGISAYGLIMTVNVLILFFGIMVAAFGIYQLVNFGDESFFSRETYAMMVALGFLSTGLVFLACVGAKNPKEYPNFLFCYWCLVSALLVANFFGLFAFNTFVDSLEDAKGGENEQGLSDVVKNQLAKQSNDFILSVYTTCCTGCDINNAALNCEEEIVPGTFTDGEVFCNEGECDPALICDIENFDVNQTTLGAGCYITLETVPGFGLESDTCSVFEGFGVVGPAADGQCGGGDPKQFLLDSIKYFEDQYYKIVVPWGFFIAFLLVGWIGSFIMILCHSGGRGK